MKHIDTKIFQRGTYRNERVSFYYINGMSWILKTSCILLFVFHCSGAIAQKDSTYIQETAETFTFGIHLKYRNNNALLALPDQDYFSVHDEALLIGTRLRYKWLSSVISVPIIDDIRNTGIRPATYSVTARAYPTHFYGQLNAQFVSLSESPLITSLNQLRSAPDEAYIAQVNTFLVYGFNKEKLSLSAAYSFFERQRQSIGSWMIAGQFDGAWWYLPEDQWFAWGEDKIDFDRVNTIRYMLGGGYSYSWVHKSFCVNVLATTGIELVSSVRKSIDNAASDDLSRSLRYVPIPRLMGSVAHYFSDYYIACTAEYTADFKPSELYHARFQEGFVRLSFGKFVGFK